MKRRYQIEGHRAVQSFRRWAAEKNPNIQMLLPLAEVVSLLQEGVGHLLREAGLALIVHRRIIVDTERKERRWCSGSSGLMLGRPSLEVQPFS